MLFFNFQILNQILLDCWGWFRKDQKDNTDVKNSLENVLPNVVKGLHKAFNCFLIAIIVVMWRCHELPVIVLPLSIIKLFFNSSRFVEARLRDKEFQKRDPYSLILGCIVSSNDLGEVIDIFRKSLLKVKFFLKFFNYSKLQKLIKGNMLSYQRDSNFRSLLIL